MADEESKQEKASKDDGKKNEKQSRNGGKKDLMVFAVMCLGVVILSTGGGMAANLFLGGSQAPPPPEGQPDPEVAGQPAEPLKIAPKAPESIQEDFKYYEFEDLTVNLNVPRVNRYLNCKILMAVRPAEKDEAFGLIEKKQIVLKNWLMSYLGDLSLDDVTGRKNINRIQREICDSLNDQLWPDQKQRIHHVFFDDFFVK